MAVVATFAVTGGWMFASLPVAGVLWSVFLVGTLGIGLLTFHSGYQALGYLSIIYCVFLVATVMTTSHKFLQGLVAETKIEQQGELIELLLNDFEENANDWLWEINHNDFLQHVSMQLVDATKQSIENLKKQKFNHILQTLLDREQQQFTTLNNQLKHHFTLGKPFKDVLLPVYIGQQHRWWSFTAKPFLMNINQ
ncbi:hypothetical protein RS130_05885 [Paraglaciecola aquimarina]|uniref:Uncharacterized protein n=1 Tax=Paraglaciecola aquimarina TaxID=1235557 RepID=A0ABU3SU29_9ALTE|nr:hypothetical protein [Paraglaciecola aquimarina]MDU0353520.1 hypothetical protein [Paraglaciecola aquimarina]